MLRFDPRMVRSKAVTQQSPSICPELWGVGAFAGGYRPLFWWDLFLAFTFFFATSRSVVADPQSITTAKVETLQIKDPSSSTGESKRCAMPKYPIVSTAS